MGNVRFFLGFFFAGGEGTVKLTIPDQNTSLMGKNDFR